MTISKLGPVDPVPGYNKVNRPGETKRQDGSDSVVLSDEAKKSAEFQRALQSAKSAPEVRTDRIEAVKMKLEDPGYLDDEHVLDETAEGILSSFGL